MIFKVEESVKKLGIKIVGVKITGIDNNIQTKEFDEWKLKQQNMLIEKYSSYDIKNDNVIEGFYNIHSKVNVPRRKNLPASENLIKLLLKKNELISINPAVDIYNILSIYTKLCLGAHDIDKIDGGVTLKILDGSEYFLPLGSSDVKEIKSGEYGFVDENNDVICWLDIRQVDKTKVTSDTKNILYFIIGNEETSYDELVKCGEDIINITTKYCGGKGEILKNL